MARNEWTKQDSLDQRESMEKSALSTKLFFFAVIFVGGFLAYGTQLSTGIDVIGKILGTN